MINIVSLKPNKKQLNYTSLHYDKIICAPIIIKCLHNLENFDISVCQQGVKERYTDDSVCDRWRKLAVLRVYRAETGQERRPPGGLPGTSQSVPVVSIPTTKKRRPYTKLTLNLQ